MEINVLTWEQSRHRILGKLVDLDDKFALVAVTLQNNWNDLHDRALFTDEEAELNIPSSDVDEDMPPIDHDDIPSDIVVPEYLR